jgi:hypothetical protein
MKVLVLAGLFTVVTTPFAFAAGDATECQIDDTRRTAQQRAEQPASPALARPLVAEREVGPVAPAPARAPAERRRNGKRIPDAQLIGPRGAL